PKRFVNFDLFLNAVDSEDGLVLDCDYNLDLFDRTTIERWLGHYETLLENMAAEPAKPISTLCLLNEAERRQLTVEWNDTRQEYQQGRCVHQLIEAQVGRTPQASAVTCGTRTLTYVELDSDANCFAQFLRQRGVSLGERVGICLDRSTEMLVTVLAVLKA